jgi:catechol-2,3-dioxygenase
MVSSLKKSITMKALKFYDKEGTGFELYVDYEKQSVMMQIDAPEGVENPQLLEFDEQDIDDIIISFVELKNEVTAIRNSSNN